MQKNQIKEISNEFFSVSVRLLILAFMKEIKTAVTDKHQFDGRDESFLVKTFRKFRTIRFTMEGLILKVFQWDPPQQEYGFANAVLIDNLKL